MIIIGKTNDDKGSQLETLVFSLLKKMNHKNCVTNYISNGGEEIDVIAEFCIPSMSENKVVKIICECKAYQSKISINDWLKFLGKLFTKEKTESNDIHGYFIALNGANGNVIGHYNELKKYTNNILLITQNELTQKIFEHFSVTPFEEVYKNIKSYTNKIIINTELVYYNNHFFWLIIFPENIFTLLGNDGKPLKQSENKEFIQLVSIQTQNNYTNFLDLIHEKEIQIMENEIFQKLISNLFEQKEIRKQEFFDNLDPFKKDLFNKFVENKKFKHILKLESDTITFVNEKNIPPGDLSILLNQFFLTKITEELFLPFYCSDLFKKSLNKKFIGYISEIYGNLDFNRAEQEKIIRIIKLSPSALLYTINPDPMIVSHRNKTYDKHKEIIDKNDRDIFFHALYDRLLRDYNTIAFSSFFFEKNNIVEIESILNIKLKSNEKILLEDSIKKRIGLGKHEGTEKVIQILKLNTLPEPWEW